MRCASFFLLTILCLVVAVAPAMADTLWDNGRYNGQTDAWQINLGFAVSDSFLPAYCYYCYPPTVQGFSIATWNIPGDDLLNLEMQLGSASFGSDYGDHVLAPSGSTDLGGDQFGYEIWRYDFSFAGVQVPGASTSWITLLDATVTNGDPIYWDENSGVGCQSWRGGCPSAAYQTDIGSIPSEAFTMTGTVCWWCYATTPEPSSILLFGSGVLALAGILRRRLNR